MFIKTPPFTPRQFLVAHPFNPRYCWLNSEILAVKNLYTNTKYLDIPTNAVN